MNNIFKNICMVLAGALLFASCDKADYPDRFTATEGLPTIYGIKYIDSGVYTDKAYMEETLCIMGKNLRSIHNVYFNDQEANINTSYLTDNTFIVTVPKTMAVVETNKIYFYNKKGESVEYPFTTLPPAPKTKEMSFEYAEPGSTVSIYGDYFYEKEGSEIQIEFAGAEVPHSDIEIVSLSEVKVKIPEGAQPGRVKITTASGISQSQFMYKDNRGLLFDFDGFLYSLNKGWHAVPVTNDGVSGNCITFDFSAESITADGGDWHDGAVHFEYWAGNWQDPESYGTEDGQRLCDIVDFTNFKNMCVKFEVNIPSDRPWTGCPCQIMFSGGDLVSNGNAGVKDIYDVTLAGCNNTYFHDTAISLPRYLWRPWQSSGSYDTGGEWRTITVPFSSFTDYYDGTKATGALTKDSFANLELFFGAGSASEGTAGCNPLIKIDNIRAVPVK